MIPALLALFVSMAFTLYAIKHPDTASLIALPLGIIVIVLLLASAMTSRGKAR